MLIDFAEQRAGISGYNGIEVIRLLRNKIILAHILVKTVDEF